MMFPRMKLFLAVLAFINLSTAQDDNKILSFEQFVTKFDKRYESEHEYQLRKVIYEKNLDVIRQHNAFSVKNHKLGINPFTDMEEHELPRGYSKARKQGSASIFRHLSEQDLPEMLPLSDLPQSVDWRTRGVTTPVKSQGMCGSCWAFASTAVLESHIAIRTGTLFSLSEQELVSCAPNPQNCGGGGGCTGATAEIAFEWVHQHGVVQEWDFGYQSYHGENVNCSLVSRVGSLRGTDDEYYQGAVATIDGYYSLPSNNYSALMNVVAQLGPVAVSVACLPWHLYRSGVFYAPLNSTKAADVNHLVVLEGYGTDEELGEDFWLIRNSWGPLWGEGGYIRLKRVDPEALDDPDSDCGMDVTPSDGVACTKDPNGQDIIPEPVKICGNSGILYDTAIPLGGRLL